jgi:hypothetical protein
LIYLFEFACSISVLTISLLIAAHKLSLCHERMELTKRVASLPMR